MGESWGETDFLSANSYSRVMQVVRDEWRGCIMVCGCGWEAGRGAGTQVLYDRFSSDGEEGGEEDPCCHRRVQLEHPRAVGASS